MSLFKQQLHDYQCLINDFLERCFPEFDEVLEQSMRYSIMAGGKRIRPVLSVSVCEMLGSDPKKALGLAGALEMIHTYSLIYDDLPCMDNDTLRRGKPTNHVVFGEDIALMAGMGLYARAFETVSDTQQEFGLTDRQVLDGIKVLASASGTNGIVSGQVLDIGNVEDNPKVDLDYLMRIHRLKTSAMLEAAVELGAIAANATVQQSESLCQYAKAIGLAFQIRDDILDVIGDQQHMGKSVGKDKLAKKITFVDLLGIERAQNEVERLTKEAKESLSVFANREFLSTFADVLCGRMY